LQINSSCDIRREATHSELPLAASVGDCAYLGIGTVVLRDVESNAKVIGVPARRIE
jgi:acetyltransferase-like isoleucine patch superfamily enzyme